MSKPFPYSTLIGKTLHIDQEKGTEELLLALRRRHGNVLQTAKDLKMSRRQLYRVIYRANVWAEVDAMRTAVPELIRRALET